MSFFTVTTSHITNSLLEILPKLFGHKGPKLFKFCSWCCQTFSSAELLGLFFHRSLPQSSRVEYVAVSLTRKFEHAQKEKKSIVFRSCPFSSPQPAVFWSRGLETRGSPLVRYKLYRVALERVWPILLPEPLGLICTKRNDGTVASRMGLQALVMLSLSLSLWKVIYPVDSARKSNVCAAGAWKWHSDMHNYDY